MQPHHQSEMQRRVEKLFNDGDTTIAKWEQYLWYGAIDSDASMYADIKKRYLVLFENFYGDTDSAHIQVLRKTGQTVFLNNDLLVELHALTD